MAIAEMCRNCDYALKPIVEVRDCESRNAYCGEELACTEFLDFIQPFIPKSEVENSLGEDCFGNKIIA